MGMNMKSVQMSELDTLDVTCKNVVPNYQNIQKIYLVGGAITILKHMKVNGKDDIPYIVEDRKCSKPPTRYSIGF